MQFIFDYKPEAKQRPRFGAGGKVHNPQKKKHLAYKWEAAAQMRSKRPERMLESPVSFGMRVHVPMPKSWSQKRKKEHLHKPVLSKPDIDNYLKWYMDILNGIAYTDDKLISQGWFEKIWDYEGKVEVGVSPYDMSLQDELEILRSTAVHLHQGLCAIYELINSEKKVEKMDKFVSKIKEICLESGLNEIYGE